MSIQEIQNKQAQIDQIRSSVRTSRALIENIEAQLQSLVKMSPQMAAQMKPTLLRQWDDQMDLLEDYLDQLVIAVNAYQGLQEVQQFPQLQSQCISIKQTHRGLVEDLKKEKELLTAIITAEKKAIVVLNDAGYQRFVQETNQAIQDAQQRKQTLEAENDPNNADAIAAEAALIQKLQNKLHIREQSYLAQSQIVTQIGQDKAAKQSSVSQLSNAVDSNLQGLENALAEIHKVNDPRYLVNNFNDNTPFLLLPVRVETRYMKIKYVRRVIPGDTAPGFSIPDKDELWVRIFPDDIAIHSHENRLSAGEEIAGHTYWSEFWGQEIEDGIDPQLAAWRVLVDSFGHERAAWIAKETTPTNLPADPEAPYPLIPSFPVLELKPASWVDFAKSYVMPDRFVVRLYTDENTYREVTGNSIPDPLPIGIDPSDDDELLFDQEEGELNLPDGMGWLTDFNKAKAYGMGLSIPLVGAELNGIHRILVLGLKLKANKSEATQLVEELFDNHHYSNGGFSLIKQGTPTNNTDNSKSGYAKLKEDAKNSLDVEVKSPLFSSETNILDKKDGQWFADLMGIDKSVVEHTFQADGTDVCEAIAMNRALWPATMGYYIKQMLHPHVSKTDRNHTQLFFNEFVTGRGKIPAFRIDNQPYGVITSSAYSRWDYTGTLNSTGYFYKRLNSKVLQPTLGEWKRIVAEKVEHVDIAVPATDRSAHFMHILTLHASSVEFYQRFANGTNLLWNFYQFLNEAESVPLDFLDLSSIDGVDIETLKVGFNDILLLALAEPAKIFELSFLESDRLLNGPVIDGFDPLPYSEIRGIQAFPGTELNYIHWLTDPTTTIARIRTEAFDNLTGVAPSQEPPKALLYLLLRHAYLQQYLETSTGILIGAGVASTEAELELELQDIGALSSLSEEAKALVLKDVSEELTIAKKVQIAQQVVQEFQGNDPERYEIRARENQLFGQAQQTLQQEINTAYNSRVSAYQSNTVKWDYLTNGYPNVSGTMPMESYINNLLINNNSSTVNLGIVKDALEKLKGLPTARLERAFAEHLDLCNYRIDGWMNGLVTERLEKQQNSQKGVYLGAFGMLENLKPNTSHPGIHVVEVDGNQNVLDTSPAVTQPFNYIGNTTASLERDTESGKVRSLPTTDTTNQGFIHTPSVSHAVAAAILRAGYIANKEVGTADNDNAMAVNLTSKRMRRALFYLEGVQNGQALPALLGYRLERELHEVAIIFGASQVSNTLDQYILELREKYPLNIGVVSDIEVGESIDKQEARNVIDGLALLNDFEENEATYATILGGVGITPADRESVITQVKKIQNDMDALGDLLLSESIFQLAKGNTDRSGAVLKALGQGAYIQKPEILETPRQSIALTHRFGIQFDKNITSSTIWTVNGTPRSTSEPGLNGWLYTQLPEPNKIAFKTEYDTYIEDVATTHQNTIYLSDLDLEPIDFISILGNQGNAEDATELSERIAHYITTTYVLEDNITVRINYTDSVGLASDEFSFFQLLALIKELKSLIGNSRALNGEDFLLPNDIVEVSLLSATENRLRQVAGIDPGFANNITDLITSLNSKISEAGLPGEAMPVVPETTLNNLRAEMVKASAFGIKKSIPGALFNNSETNRDQLVSQAQSIVKQLNQRFDKVTPIFTELAAITEMKIAYRLMGQIGEILFGRYFKVFPEFNLVNAADVTTARSFDNLLNEAGDMAVEEWTQGIAKVRPKMSQYQRMRLIGDSIMGTFTDEPIVTQLPLYPSPIPDGFTADDVRWVGMKLPDDYSFAGDTLSLVLEIPEDAEATDIHAGMIIDEWTETIPLKNVHTGVAMHYNEPNAEAPNTLIMAVTPEETGEWEWDDLMDTLNETLQMAKNRAVEPDQLQDELWGQTLPALLAAITSNDSAPSLDFARNIINVANGQSGRIAPSDYAVG